jgi:hypothetical protein
MLLENLKVKGALSTYSDRDLPAAFAMSVTLLAGISGSQSGTINGLVVGHGRVVGDSETKLCAGIPQTSLSGKRGTSISIMPDQ